MNNGTRVWVVLAGICLYGFASLSGCGQQSGESIVAVPASAKVVSLETIPASPSMAAGTMMQLDASGRFSDQSSRIVTREVVWSSGNARLASVDQTGQVASGPDASGTVIITAVSGTIAASTTITFSPVSSIAVTPDAAAIGAGLPQQFAAMGTLANGATQDITRSVAWSSSSPGVAVVDKAGLARTVAPGSATIIASINALSSSATLTAFGSVAPAAPPPFVSGSTTTTVPVSGTTVVSLTVTPSVQTLPPGGILQFSAVAELSDGSFRDVTADAAWTSSNPLVASVSSSAGTTGLVTALVPGTATISAVFSGVASGQAVLTVSSATVSLSGFRLAPANPSLRPGEFVQFSLTPVSSTGTFIPVQSAGLVWQSSNGFVAAVSQQGVATALNTGSALITATSGGVTISTVLVVVPR